MKFVENADRLHKEGGPGALLQGQSLSFRKTFAKPIYGKGEKW